MHLSAASGNLMKRTSLHTRLNSVGLLHAAQKEILNRYRTLNTDPFYPDVDFLSQACWKINWHYSLSIVG